MKIGLQLHPERGVDYVLTEARNADSQGFDSVWLGDHLMSGKGSWRGPDGPAGPLDSFTLMTAVGAVTSHVRLAWSMLNVSFRYPAMLAKMLASLDQITKGRVICSIGSDLPEEYVAYGIPVLHDHDDRVGYTREIVELLKELWTHPAPEKTSFQGKHIQTVELPFNPKPYQTPHPPIWIGGESDQTIEIVKDLADGWVTLTRSMDAGEKGAVHAGRPNVESLLSRTLASSDWPTDRPMTVVAQARVFVAERRDDAIAEISESLDVTGDALDTAIQREIVGTSEECLEQFEQIARTGANLVRVAFDSLGQQQKAADLQFLRFPEAFK